MAFRENSTQADMLLRSQLMSGGNTGGLDLPNQQMFANPTQFSPKTAFAPLPGTAVTSDRMKDVLRALRERAQRRNRVAPTAIDTIQNLFRNFG